MKKIGIILCVFLCLLLGNVVYANDGADGKDSEENIKKEAEKTEQEQTKKPTPEPKVIVVKCKDMPEQIVSGDTFTMKAILKNTNKKKAVQNMTVTVTVETEGLTFKGESNVSYYENLGPGKSLEIPLAFYVEEGAKSGNYQVTLEMSYDNPDAVALTSTGKIQIHVKQKARAELEVGGFAEEVSAGDSVNMPVQVINLGRGSIYNARCTLEVPGLEMEQSLFLGNIEGGNAKDGELLSFAGMVHENAASNDEKYGNTSGKIKLVYESENGEENVLEKEIKVKINPLQIAAIKEVEKKDESNIEVQLLAGIGVLITIMAIGTLVIFVIRRKRY